MDNLIKQDEEIESLSAIYGPEFQIVDEKNKAYNIEIINDVNKNICVTLHIKFPENYPSTSPPEFEISAPHLKQEDKMHLCHLLDDVCLYKSNLGECVIFQCIEKVREELNEIATDLLDKLQNKTFMNQEKELSNNGTLNRSKCPAITHGKVISDRKSSFQGHCATVHSVEQVRQVLSKLKEHKKIQQAKHNIYAYRIYNESTKTYLHDCDNDGELQAGSRLLHLLEIMDAKNAVVIVTRWYGGIHLGPDRFRHINNAARQALNEANLVPNK